MRLRKGGSIVIAGLLGIAAQAQAEQWSGAYIGINAGHGHMDAETESRGAASYWSGAGGGAVAAVAQAGSTTGRYDSRPEGEIYGVQLGYNWQSGAVLFGVEADLQDSNMSDTSTFAAFTPVEGFPGRPLSSTLRHKSSLDYMATLRARLGYAGERWLVYGTAGLAFGRVESDVSYSGGYRLEPAIVFDELDAKKSSMRTGFVVGAGAEYSFLENWTARAEYVYFDLGETTQRYDVVSRVPATGFNAGTSVRATTDWTGSLLRLGLNYRF